MTQDKVTRDVAPAQTTGAKNLRCYAISSSSGVDGRLYWHRHCWSYDLPRDLYAADEAEREVDRLRASLRHDKTIQKVDVNDIHAMTSSWNEAFNAQMDAQGYGGIPHAERQSVSAKAIRAAARGVADQAVRNAGYPDFNGWTEWSRRPAPATPAACVNGADASGSEDVEHAKPRP